MKNVKKAYFRKVKYTVKNSRFDDALTIYCFDNNDNSIIRVIRIKKKWLAKYLMNDLINSISFKYKDDVIE